MNETFTFNGVTSSDFGVYISGEATYNAPERSVEMVTVPGRNGTVAIDQGRWENVELTYPAFCWAESQSGFAAKVSAFRNALLSNIGYKRLEDDFHPDEFRQAIYKSGLEVDPSRYNTAGEFSLTFDCKPQRFLKSGETSQTFSADGTITNPTRFSAAPLLEVTGKGTVGIGSYSFEIVGGVAGQTIIIDCDVMEAWEMSGGAKIPRNDYIQYAGNTFPRLEPGADGVTLGAGITQIKITPRWWRL